MTELQCLTVKCKYKVLFLIHCPATMTSFVCTYRLFGHDSLFAVQHVLGILNVTVERKFPHVANHSYFITIKLESPP